MGKKQFCFFQTAETGNRTPDSGVKGSGANHYPRAPAHARLQRVQNCLAKVVTKAPPPRFSRSVPILKQLHWLPVRFRIHFNICTIFFRTLIYNQPAYLADLLARPKCSKYLRSINSNTFVVPRIKTGSRAFSISGPDFWNALFVPIRNAQIILTCRNLLKSHLFDILHSYKRPCK